MQELFDALCAAIRSELAIEPVLLPQKAMTATSHINITLKDVAENGEGGETILLNAEYRSGGTGSAWTVETAKAKRRLIKVELTYMPVAVRGNTLRAYWTRQREPFLEYPDGDGNGGMPAAYVAPYTVRIDYPARLVSD